MITTALSAPTLPVSGLLPQTLRSSTAQNVTISRLPGSGDPVVDGFIATAASLPAGIHGRTRTAATELRIGIRTSLLRLAGRTESVPARLVVLVDGHEHAFLDLDGPITQAPDATGVLQRVDAPVQTWTVPTLPAGDKLVEIWLPQSAFVDELTVYTDESLHAPDDDRARWIHYGSSISHCLEADSPTGTWPAVAARALGVESISLGFAGQAMLDPFVARLIRDAHADLISVKVGINLVNIGAAYRRTFRSMLHGFLDTIREGHPHTPIVVCSPIACPVVEDAAGPTLRDPVTGMATSDAPPAALERGALSLRLIRDEISSVLAARRATDPHLHHIDGLELLAVDEAHLLIDGLHPGPAGYRLMGERFAERIRTLELLA